MNLPRSANLSGSELCQIVFSPGSEVVELNGLVGGHTNCKRRRPSAAYGLGRSTSVRHVPHWRTNLFWENRHRWFPPRLTP
jgi:hypothetical protein